MAPSRSDQILVTVTGGGWKRNMGLLRLQTPNVDEGWLDAFTTSGLVVSFWIDTEGRDSAGRPPTWGYGNLQAALPHPKV